MKDLSSWQQRLIQLQKDKSDKDIINLKKQNNMKSIFIGLFATIGLIAVVLFAAVINGTILWLLYPYIFEMFPNAATSGVLAATLSWKASVAITYIFGILIRSEQSNTNKKD